MTNFSARARHNNKSIEVSVNGDDTLAIVTVIAIVAAVTVVVTTKNPQASAVSYKLTSGLLGALLL